MPGGYINCVILLTAETDTGPEQIRCGCRKFVPIKTP
jgi:hypothetical protein